MTFRDETEKFKNQ